MGIIYVAQPFDLADILDGTQDFRWFLRQDGWYSGVLAGTLLHVRQVHGGLEYRAENDLTDLLRRYFRLDDDLDSARAELASVDVHVRKLVNEAPCLRVLRQPDPWECMVSYICSANNNVARIREIVETIAAQLGQPVELDGEVRHTFPSPAAVLGAGEEKLAKMRLGLNRHAKIVAAAKRICDGELDLQHLAQPQTPYIQAKRELMECRGVGPKIADCIALFALDKPEAFPVDVWIRRALGTYSRTGKRLPTPVWSDGRRTTSAAMPAWLASCYSAVTVWGRRLSWLGRALPYPPCAPQLTCSPLPRGEGLGVRV